MTSPTVVVRCVTVTLMVCHSLSCTDVGLFPGSLDNLDVQLLSASIYANLMPIVPPDPIRCQLTLLAKNGSRSVELGGIRVPQTAVFLSSTNERLGTILFSTQWDGHLDAGEQDTVRLATVPSRFPQFSPPCGEYVRLEVRIENQSHAVRTFTVDSLLFGCVY